MISAVLIVIYLVFGFFSWFFGRRSAAQGRRTALTGTSFSLLVVIVTWIAKYRDISLLQQNQWFSELRAPWISSLGISVHFALDGLSLLLVALTALLGVAAVLTSWNEIRERAGLFYLNVLWILAGIIGVFSSLDLFLFYFFWELMLVPMYLLINIWGHENRIYASIKFFVFTQASGLLMLLSIVALYFIHGAINGQYSFDYLDLLGTELPLGVSIWLMLGFFIAFAVKLPVILLHTWLPDAHTEAPTAGSVILAGLLLKTGGYGLLRFVLPLFPQASQWLAPAAMTLGAAGIIYGAWVAVSQADLKRLVAYTSVSHLGFVLLGIFSFNQLAYQGSVFEMLAHGLSTSALFIIAGQIQERTHTRELAKMGGFWVSAPRMGALGLFFALASLGLPGLGNFVAEMLVLFGSFQVSRLATIVATAGFILGTVYSLWIVQRVFHGPNPREQSTQMKPGIVMTDLSWREFGTLGAMALLLVWLGLFPQTVLNTTRASVSSVKVVLNDNR